MSAPFLSRLAVLACLVPAALSAQPSSGTRAAASTAASAADTLPDTPVTKVARAYVAAFNTGDAEKLRAFFTGNLSPSAEGPPVEQRLINHRRLIDNLGTLTILGGTVDAAGHVELKCRSSKNSDPVAVIMDVDPKAPHRVTGFGGVRVGD